MSGRELFAIFRQGDCAPMWAAVVTPHEANNLAVVAAANHGNVELLSGRDLVDRLGELHDLCVEEPGGPGSRGETDEHGIVRWHRAPKAVTR